VLDADPSFRPVRRRDGYLALEDLGLIGDGTTSALVGLDGSVVWLCIPRFDSEPVFSGLLDHAKGGISASPPTTWSRRGSATSPIPPSWSPSCAARPVCWRSPTPWRCALAPS
jgi:Domain of unknown function (DUF5911)